MLIEIDSHCNLNCKTCPRLTRPGEQGSMSLDMFKDCVDKLIESRFSNSLYLAGYGESMLNPDFFEMIKYAKQKDCYIMMPTNATKINNENVKQLRMIDTLYLSIDSLKDKKRRTQNPNDILKIIDLMMKHRVRPALNTTLGTSNWKEIDDFIRFSIKNDIVLNFTAPRPLNSNDEFLMKETKFVGEHAHILRERIKPYPNIYFDEYCRSFSHCRVKKNDLAISWNGDIYPCSAAFFQIFKFGNIRDCRSLDKIAYYPDVEKVWNGNHEVCNYCKEYDKIYDFHESKSDGELKKIHNKYANKRCFVLGTGKSLKESILKQLKNEITIGVNGIAFAKKLYDFEPTFLCFSDHGCISDTDSFNAFKSVNSIMLYSNFLYYHALAIDGIELSEENIDFLNKRIDVKWRNAGLGWLFHITDANDISFDLINEGTAMCGTVVQDLAIPVASWLGCKEIYLLGCDCDGSGHFYGNDDEKNVNNLNAYGTRQYKHFRDKVEAEGGRLYNLGDSEIPFIENVDISDVLK